MNKQVSDIRTELMADVASLKTEVGELRSNVRDVTAAALAAPTLTQRAQ